MSRPGRSKAKAAPSSADSSNSTGRRAAKDATKDLHGGLTAKGREAFKRRDGSHLEPGVRKAEGDMSPDEMCRKGSWAARFYGRRGPLPPLQDKHGEPTRFALSAAAWGERVPRTEAEACRIAEKGRTLLDRDERERDQGATGKRANATVGGRRGTSSKTRSARRA